MQLADCPTRRITRKVVMTLGGRHPGSFSALLNCVLEAVTARRCAFDKMLFVGFA